MRCPPIDILVGFVYMKAIWKCNDKIAEQNFNRLENMNLYNRLRSDLSSDSEYVFERKIK